MKRLSKKIMNSKPLSPIQKIHFFIAICVIVVSLLLLGMDKFSGITLVGNFSADDLLLLLVLYGLIVVALTLLKCIMLLIKRTGLLMNRVKLKVEDNINTVKERNRLEQERLERERKEKEQKAEHNRIRKIAQGMWEFPNVDLYKRCEKSGVTDLNSSFARRKVYATAKQILSENDIPKEFFVQYIGNEEDLGEGFLESRFENGKRQVYDDLHSMKKGKLSEEHREMQELSKKVCNLYGHEKRRFMLKNSIRILDDKIQKYEDGQKAMRELGMILGSSAAQESKKDWAVLGGIASGIAGAGAGVAVAANAMAENAAIERRNKQSREAATQIATDILCNASSMNGEIANMRDARKIMQHHLDELDSKIVMNEYSAGDISRRIERSVNINKMHSEKGLEISVMFKSSLKADVPNGVNVVADGTFDVEIFYEGKAIDRVCVALPLFGLPRGEYITLKAYSDRYVKADGKYTAKVHYNKLWAMEV